MIFDTFKKKSFKNRIKDTKFLIKNTFKVIKKEKDIKKSITNMAVLSGIITILIYLGIILFFTQTAMMSGIILVLIAVFILTPYRFFYNVRQKADQSWLVYNTICGKNISYQEAHNHTKTKKGKLRLIAVIDIIVKYAQNRKRRQKGVGGILTGVFFGFLSEVWDLLSHYMLPAIVIEQKSLRKIIPEIKSIKDNVPATLMGVFGIDFAGHIIGLIIGIAYLFALVFSIGIGFIVGLVTSATIITIGTISFSWIPVLITLFIVSIIGGIYEALVESIKVIYFTIFYTSIQKPLNISTTIREELTHYLLLEESDKQYESTISPPNKLAKKLSEYIKKYEDEGHSQEELKKFLLSKGYKEKDIDSGINMIK